jgi:hypothetical protein
MRVFLDFEASSLHDDGYPIELGWVGEDGSAESHLIRPAPAWTDWDVTAEAVHRISRAQLEAEGEPHEAVARRTLEALQGEELFASAPSWDGKWLSVLLRGGGLPRHALRLKDSDAAHHAAVVEALEGRLPEAQVEALAVDLLQAVRLRRAAEPPRHRALADAQAELEVFREVRRLAEVAAARL